MRVRLLLTELEAIALLRMRRTGLTLDSGPVNRATKKLNKALIKYRAAMIVKEYHEERHGNPPYHIAETVYQVAKKDAGHVQIGFKDRPELSKGFLE